MKNCKCIAMVVIICVIAILVSSCFAFKSLNCGLFCHNVEDESADIETTETIYLDANPEEAKDMLNSFYRAAVYYSATQGGNGQSRYPTTLIDIKDFLPTIYWNALIVVGDESAVPVGGYIIEMLPDSTGDTFKFIAHPAKYKTYQGDTFSIDQTEHITNISKGE